MFGAAVAIALGDPQKLGEAMSELMPDVEPRELDLGDVYMWWKASPN